MVFDTSSGIVVRTKPGERTGEQYYQTADGQWWKDWDGAVRTGEEVKTLRLSERR